MSQTSKTGKLNVAPEPRLGDDPSRQVAEALRGVEPDRAHPRTPARPPRRSRLLSGALVWPATEQYEEALPLEPHLRLKPGVNGGEMPRAQRKGFVTPPGLYLRVKRKISLWQLPPKDKPLKNEDLMSTSPSCVDPAKLQA